jgi:hypothetical protein
MAIPLAHELETHTRLSVLMWDRRYVLAWGLAALLTCGGLFLGGGSRPLAADEKEKFSFDMERSAAAEAAGCLADARADVRITPLGPVEKMDVNVKGLPPNTEFDFFVIQAPNNPFGLSWYQGDIETDDEGSGHGRFIGRFNIETFIVAPGSVPAPVVHEDASFPDADVNPQTAPVHTFHLGLWFNSPLDAVKAGCPATVTPFNGDHTAGIQVLSTKQFPALEGPLRQVLP